MIACVPVTSGGQLDPRWGRAARVAIAQVADGRISSWQEHEVGWDALHDEGTEGGHHARIARFLREHAVDTVIAGHMGAPMARMLESMDVTVHLGATGDARDAILEAVNRGA
jgi:predicted Fe-Mo cluster-binding NifX family protein